MNYRHAFHAGNFADVFKHVLLTRILLHLARKPTAFRYLDTHSGLGLYDLDGSEARRGAEWPDGIGRSAPAAMTEEARVLVAPYLDALGPRDAQGRPSLYPGSPLLALHFSRPQDRLTFCELLPAGAESLRRNVGRSARAKVIAIDGYTALNAYVPPPERRGLVLVDPPFETRTEFDDLLAGLGGATRKWPTGTYALWYPIKDRQAVSHFTTALMATALKRVAQVELIVDRTALMRGALGGCGLAVVNPPHTLEAEAAVILPALAAALGRQEPGSWQWGWLRDE